MKKIKLKIRVMGDPILSSPAKPVAEVTDDHRELFSSMSRMMYESSGVGLAAVQVGVDQALFVADIGSGLYKLANPKIIRKEGSQSMEEGCLSLPGISVEVERGKRVVLEALDQDGKPVVIEAEGLLATVFQHEVDHLNGRLILDYASAEEKEMIKKKMSNFKEIG